ncbi:MAG: hypothetical protein GY796_06345 [Chloroflexi bacterium]|nr:hypothetical protein [Chloroflexota bacterium]
MQHPAYQIKINFAIELVKQLLSQMDAAACLVLAGDLSRFRSFDLTDVSREEIEVENNVYQASYGRLYIPLIGHNKYILKKEALPHVGIRTLIQDVQLERYGRLLFHAPDYCKNGAWLCDWFKLDFLETLEYEGVIQIEQAQPSANIIQRRTTAYQANLEIERLGD